MNIEYNKIYEFDMSGKVSFGDLSQDILNRLFTDGRVASKFLENHLPLWFPELEYVDTDGHDHVHKVDGRKFDLKSFTKGGCIYAPSNMVGKGRVIVIEDVYNHAKHVDYIISDIIDFPKIKIVVKTGSSLITEFPSAKIKFSERQKLFP